MRHALAVDRRHLVGCGSTAARRSAAGVWRTAAAVANRPVDNQGLHHHARERQQTGATASGACRPRAVRAQPPDRIRALARVCAGILYVLSKLPVRLTTANCGGQRIVDFVQSSELNPPTARVGGILPRSIEADRQRGPARPASGSGSTQGGGGAPRASGGCVQEPCRRSPRLNAAALTRLELRSSLGRDGRPNIGHAALRPKLSRAALRSP